MYAHAASAISTREKRNNGIFPSPFPFFLPFFLAIVMPFLWMCKVTVFYNHTETNKGDRLILFRHAETSPWNVPQITKSLHLSDLQAKR